MKWGLINQRATLWLVTTSPPLSIPLDSTYTPTSLGLQQGLVRLSYRFTNEHLRLKLNSSKRNFKTKFIYLKVEVYGPDF